MVSDAMVASLNREPREEAARDDDGLRRRRDLVSMLFNAYYSRVFSFARQASDAATAEDVSQEVFLRLLGHEGLEEKDISISYLLKVAHNLIRRRAQRHKRHEEFVRRESECPSRRPGETRHESLEASVVQEGIQNLSDHEREAVRLIVCHDLSYEAAAKSLDVSTTTINNWKFRGMQKLRDVAYNGGSPRPRRGEDRIGPCGRGRQELPASPRRPGD